MKLQLPFRLGFHHHPFVLLTKDLRSVMYLNYPALLTVLPLPHMKNWDIEIRITHNYYGSHFLLPDIRVSFASLTPLKLNYK